MDETTDGVEAGERPEQAAPRDSFLGSARLMVALVVVVVVLLVVSGVALYRSETPDQPRSAGGPITSVRARDSGLTAAATLAQRVLSYSWKTLAADRRATEKVLAPSFRSQYRTAMDGVQDQTVSNQVVLSARVVDESVISASERKVEALVFVDQTTTAEGAHRRVDQNRLRVTLTRQDGAWRVSKMDSF